MRRVCTGKVSAMSALGCTSNSPARNARIAPNDRRAYKAEPAAAPDRGRMTVVRGIMSPKRPRQLSGSFGGGGGPNMVRVGFGFTVFVLLFGASVAANKDKPDNSLPRAARDILASADKLEVLSINVARK